MTFEQLVKLVEVVSASDLTDFEYKDKAAGVHLSMGKEKETIVNHVPYEAPVTAPVIAPMASIAPSVASAAVTTQASSAVAVAAPQAVQMDMTAEPEGTLVTSPLVGTFYVAPQEGADPFVKVGDQVKKGQVLAIVEAMKLMNDIECEQDGTIVEVLAENGQGVEYGQPLFRIR